jgi:hypothetical protein
MKRMQMRGKKKNGLKKLICELIETEVIPTTIAEII